MMPGNVLRWQGGKFLKRKQFSKMLKVFSGTRSLTAVFAGALGAELELSRQGMKVRAFDIDERLVNFHQTLLRNPLGLVQSVHTVIRNRCFAYQTSKNGKKKYGIAKQQHEELKPLSYNPGTIGAAAYYVVNKTSVSGDMQPHVGISENPKNQRLTDSNIEELLKPNGDITVERLGFEHSIKNDASLIYADPPYDKIRTPLYKGHDSFDHELLAEKLNERGFFVLSYGNTKRIKDLYKKCHIFRTKWGKGRKADDKNGKRKVNDELIIISPDVGSYAHCRKIVEESGFALIDLD